jgi:methyl-accepting chemotaxis protein
MTLWLAALIAFAVVTVAGLGFAGWRGLQLWRTARRTMKVVGVAMDRTSAKLEELSAATERLSAAPGRVSDSVAELQETLTKARVIANAASEARTGAQGATRMLRR